MKHRSIHIHTHTQRRIVCPLNAIACHLQFRHWNVYKYTYADHIDGQFFQEHHTINSLQTILDAFTHGTNTEIP